MLDKYPTNFVQNPAPMQEGSYYKYGSANSTALLRVIQAPKI